MPEEWKIMQRHCAIGAGILQQDIQRSVPFGAPSVIKSPYPNPDRGNPFLVMASSIALTHHEWWDGTGYPQGLQGHAISLGGRIVAVTDSYETMTAGRPYRKALSVKAAREELVRRSGSHFDPDVVRALLAISLGRLWPVVGIGALIAEVPFLAPVLIDRHRGGRV